MKALSGEDEIRANNEIDLAHCTHAHIMVTRFKYMANILRCESLNHAGVLNCICWQAKEDEKTDAQVPNTHHLSPRTMHGDLEGYIWPVGHPLGTPTLNSG